MIEGDIEGCDGDKPNIKLEGCAVEHTETLILRPSVTSSGRIRRKSSRQSPPSKLLPTVDPTVPTTSFHEVNWIARLAKQTES